MNDVVSPINWFANNEVSLVRAFLRDRAFLVTRKCAGEWRSRKRAYRTSASSLHAANARYTPGDVFYEMRYSMSRASSSHS